MRHRTCAWVLCCAWLAVAMGARTADAPDGADVARLVEAGRYAEADALLAARLARDPADVEAHYYSGMITALTEKADRYDEAIAHLERCVALQPRVSNYHLWLGRLNGLKARDAGVFSALGCVRVVRSSYLRALELDPRNHDARHDLLQFYLQAPAIVGGSVAKARSLAADCEPYDAAMACALRADIHLHERDYTAAQQALDALPPGASAAAVGYARELARSLEAAFTAQGEAQQARQVLERAASWQQNPMP
jgi:tetratricopeptide (TPR) repeat protein